MPEGREPTATAEPTRRPRPRIESLSDMVFGLALSVGALAVVSSPPTDSRELSVDVATFGFSFLILILVWFACTRIMSVLALETRRTVSLNALLLFSVSLEPFLFNLLKSPITNDFFQTVSQAYAIDLGVMMVVLGLFAWELATTETGGLTWSTRVEFRFEAVNRWVMAGIFFFSAVPIFGQLTVPFDGSAQPVRTLMWLIPLVYFAALRRARTKPDAG